MMIYSFHLPHSKWVTVVAILLCLLCILFLIFKVIPYLSPTGPANQLCVESEADMVAFWEGYGYQVSSEPIETADVEIPKELDVVYENYEALQQEAGFSLLSYRGKTVKRYTFEIYNHARSSQEAVRGNLLVYEKKIIGGDICSVSLNGFMSPLVKKARSGA